MSNATTHGAGAHLVARLQHRYRGWSWEPGRIVLEDFELDPESPPDDWPPAIRVHYRIGGEPGSLVDQSVLPASDVNAAMADVRVMDAVADLWVMFIHRDLVVLDEPGSTSE